jgi:hypothetical protein
MLSVVPRVESSYLLFLLLKRMQKTFTEERYFEMFIETALKMRGNIW